MHKISQFRAEEDGYFLDFDFGTIAVSAADGCWRFDCEHIPSPSELPLAGYERLAIKLDAPRGITHIQLWTNQSSEPFELGFYVCAEQRPVAMRWLTRVAKHLAILQHTNNERH